MVGISQRAYAKTRKEKGLPGGSLTAVQHALSAGRITLDSNGKIDPARADADWELNTDPGRRRAKVREVHAASNWNPSEPGAPSVEGFLRAVYAWRDRLPALFHRMGAPRGVALLSGEVLEALALSITGTRYGPIPGPTDFEAIAADFGGSVAELKALYGSQCEPWSEALLNFFDCDPHYADGLSPIAEAGR